MSKSKVLTREFILSAQSKPVEFEVSEWGGSVMVAPLTVEGRTNLMTAANIDTENTNPEDVERLALLTFIACVVDPAFTEADYDALKKANAGALDSVVKFAFELSGISDKSLQDAEKN